MQVTIKKLQIEHESIKAIIEFDEEQVELETEHECMTFDFQEIPHLSKILRKATEYLKGGADIFDTTE